MKLSTLIQRLKEAQEFFGDQDPQVAVCSPDTKHFVLIDVVSDKDDVETPLRIETYVVRSSAKAIASEAHKRKMERED